MSSLPRTFSPLGRQLGQLLQAHGLTVSTAESLTGGTIASMIAQIAGSSSYFKGSVVSYAVSVKEQVLGVDVERGGVVSEDTARQMAEGVARLCQTDCAVATTGIAGPGGAEPGKPVGTVCIAALVSPSNLSNPSNPSNPSNSSNPSNLSNPSPSSPSLVSRTYHFEGDRESVILQSADAALQLLIETLHENFK